MCALFACVFVLRLRTRSSGTFYPASYLPRAVVASLPRATQHTEAPMDGSESMSPLIIVLSAGLAIGIPLIVLLFSRRQAASPSGAGPEPAPAPGKWAYRSAKELRDELDSAGLIEEAGRRKDASNGFLQKGLLEPAMQGYLASIWLLKVHPKPKPNPNPNPNPKPKPKPNPNPNPNSNQVSRPTYPEVLSGQMPPTDEEAAGLLGGGRGAAPAPPRIPPGRVAAVQRTASRSLASVRAWLSPPPPPDALESEAAGALRLTLHLNVAACALRRDDFYLAREACAFVLAVQPASPKALYRLAQARR